MLAACSSGLGLLAPPDTSQPQPFPPAVQVGAQTETELKEKKLRVEDALNATKAAVEEGIVTGGGCTLLRLAGLVDGFKATLPNDEQKVGLGARSKGERRGGACLPPAH